MRIATLFLAVGLAGAAHAQPVVYRAGGATNEAVTAATTGRDGHPVLALSYEGTLVVDDGGPALPAAAGRDIAILRYDGGSGARIDARRIGGAGDQHVAVIAAGEPGELLVAGSTRASAQSDESRMLASVRGDGSLRFQRTLAGSAPTDRVVDLARDAEGNLYLVAARVAGATGTLVVSSHRPDGGDRWSFEIAGAPGNAAGGAIAVLGSGADARIVVYGSFDGTIELRGTAASGAATRATSQGGRDLFLASYRANDGARVAHALYGNARADGAAPGSITTDAEGRLYVGATVDASSNVPWFARGSCTAIQAAGMLVMRLSPELACEERWQFVSSPGDDRIEDLVVNVDGIHVGGRFDDVTDFDPGPRQVGIALNNASGQDGFVAKLFPDGSLDFVAPFGDPTPHANANAVGAIAVDAWGNTWSGGTFTGRVDFDPLQSSLARTASAGSDAFIVRVNGCGSVTEEGPLCRLGAQRGVSGSFIDTDISSEGVVVEILGDGRAGMYWYTFAPADALARQTWIVATGRVLSDRLEFDSTFTATGPTFGAGYDPSRFVLANWGPITIRFDDCNAAVMSFAGPPGFGSGTRLLSRLTGIPRHTCNTPVDTIYRMGVGYGASGSYYEPATAGQGFSVHVLRSGTMGISFYTFETDGTPLWVVGIGAYDGRRAIFDDLIRARGSPFRPHNPLMVVRDSWGSAIVEFPDCNRARATFSAVAPFGTDTLDAIRVGSIDGVRCPDLGE